MEPSEQASVPLFKVLHPRTYGRGCPHDAAAFDVHVCCHARIGACGVGGWCFRFGS